jgi:predicted metal-binding membrane protein
MVGLFWTYLTWMAADMSTSTGAGMAHCAAMPGMTSSSWSYVWWLFVRWAVMAIAMMLSTSLPLIFLFSRYWQAKHQQDPILASLHLVSGYLSTWFLFGVVAALTQ